MLDRASGEGRLSGEAGKAGLICALRSDLYAGGGDRDFLDAALLSSLEAVSGLIEISDGGEREKPLYVAQDAGVELNLRTGNAWLRNPDGTRDTFMGNSDFVSIEEFRLTSFGD